MSLTSGRHADCNVIWMLKHYWKFIKGQTLELEVAQVELRWDHGIQSVVTGRHPNQKRMGRVL